ncbi:MAG: hypothetical protein IT509_08440 [Rhodocyclaceae bacterium]|nr:hypothetical protein [Rhodocyclaceae bacterium]
MSTIDTSRETVERLASALEDAFYASDAALLRALVAERDAALADASDFHKQADASDFHKQADASDFHKQSEIAYAEQDRVAAEVASLRASLGAGPIGAGAEPIGCPAPGACSAVSAYARGAADMRERAAAIASDMWDAIPYDVRADDYTGHADLGWHQACLAVAAAIRALPLEARE